MTQQPVVPTIIPNQYYYMPAQQTFQPQVIQEIVGILMIVLVAAQAFSQIKSIFQTEIKGSK